MSLLSMAEVVCMETVESERKMHCPIILVSVKDPFFYIYKYICVIYICIYIYISIYISLLCMYKCVSLISTKHFAKYIQEHLHPLLGVQKSPGCNTSTAQSQNRHGTIGTLRMGSAGQHRQLRGSRGRAGARPGPGHPNRSC